ncbi:glycosyltransferase family A protein [Rhodococcus sp. 14-2470-1a]|uniref:glycosyltransferase family 2 protein n=1 Tax=Rhodococcus sp. 14-2470-1a TaxID=2023150 RepID=UPI000B9A2C29|nr:glycosyltransferase family A protein [Rhodococcus sp. 14-2470-1a]OZF55497.1 hypothetical protein CH292_05950 [Rhodococcus sp. 14-2470-1a]
MYINEIDGISVVIPTTGRATLKRAVDSVLRQSVENIEVLVVMNGRDALPDFHYDERVKIVRNPPGSGANHARQTGITRALYSFTALLDDDDFWLPDKLMHQIEFMKSVSAKRGLCVIATALSDSVKMDKNSIWPRDRFAREVTDVQDYLFQRSTLWSARRQLQSSTLLFSTSLATEVPFDRKTRLHQDWQWLLQVESKLQPTIAISSRVSVICDKASTGITAQTKWSDSMVWAENNLDCGRKSYGDFILGVPLRFAMKAGSFDGIVLCLRHGMGAKYSAPALAYGLLATAVFLLRKLASTLNATVRRLMLQKRGTAN